VKTAARARVAVRAELLTPARDSNNPARLQSLNAVTVPKGDRDLSDANQRDSAGVDHGVAVEDAGDRFDSSSEPEADGGFGGVGGGEFAAERGDGLPYNLELEKDAVFESAKAGMGMEVCV